MLQRWQPHYPASAAVLAHAEKGSIDGWISAHSLTTLFYLTARYGSRADARVAVAQILSLLHVAAVDEAVIRDALQLPFCDFEDAVQMMAAVRIGANYLITRNIEDYAAGPVPAILPAEMLLLL